MDVNSIAELFGATAKKRDKTVEFAAILRMLARILDLGGDEDEDEDGPESEATIVDERAREVRVRPRVEPLGG